MNLTNKLFEYDVLYSRIDLKRLPTYILTLLLALTWAWTGNTLKEQGLRLAAAIGFLFIVRLTVCRLGASRLSSVVAAVLAMTISWQFTAAELAEIATFGVVVLACIEYFKLPSKSLSLGLGAFAGVIAAGFTNKAATILALFIAVILARAVWHLGLERLPKKALALFIAKAIVASVVAVGAFLLLKPHYTFPWSDPDFLTLPTVHWLTLSIIVLAALRGMWATVLLQTARSPLMRGLRKFLIAFSLLVIACIVILRTFGSDIFQPSVMQRLESAGLTTFNTEILIFAAYSMLLLITAGIDRSLYKDTAIARRIHALRASKEPKTKATIV